MSFFVDHIRGKHGHYVSADNPAEAMSERYACAAHPRGQKFRYTWQDPAWRNVVGNLGHYQDKHG